MRKVQYTTQNDYASGRGRDLVDSDETDVLDLSVYPIPCHALTHDIYRGARPAPAPALVLALADGLHLGVGLHRLLSVPFAAAT